jgi:hypothetical protein
MRKLIGRFRAFTEARARSWIRRRQGPDLDLVELTRNRIYILPTRLGIAYAAMLFAMVLGGMNYNNNLGLGLTFLLVSLGFVAMHHCHGTLRGMKLRLLATQPAFVGQPVGFRLLLENDSVAPVADRLAHQDLVGERPVHVGGVEQGHPQLEGSVDRGDRLGVVPRAVEFAHPHAPEAQLRDHEPLGSQFAVLHRRSSSSRLRPTCVCRGR